MKTLSLLTALFALGLAGCDAPKQVSKEAPARPVLVAQIHYAPREREEALPGVVKARIESDLGFRVAGKIAERLVDAGATVKHGDPLARLDETDFRLQLEQAEAERRSAQAAFDQAVAEERRMETLSRQGWAANAEFDRIHATADQARNAVARTERAVALARHALDYTTLDADADGVVSLVSAEPGQVVAAGAPVIRLAHTAEREAAIAVPETLIERVRNHPARVEFWALPGVSVAARLRELSPSADPATRTYPARYSLVDAPESGRLGMSVTVVLAADGTPVARVPVGAVFDRGDGPRVFAVDRTSGALSEAAI
ncbi:MAG: efflux RND transporter periplasmic adaptor subunit, partial [Hyphomicrobiales bacterium]|nr:efflux RND transporter periplasmic adaptor subunit [Hyphomicrobiales bacterium]